MKLLLAMGGDNRCFPGDMNAADPMKLPGSGRPQLDFFNQLEQLNPFSVYPFGSKDSGCICHGWISLITDKKSSGLYPP